MRPCVERNVTAAFRSISMPQSLPIGRVRCSTQATARLVGLRACTGPPEGRVEPLVLRTRWKRQDSAKSSLLITARGVRTASALDGGLLLRALADRLGRLTSGQEAPGRSATSRSWSQNTQKADPGFRIRLLTCVGTAGFEPATPRPPVTFLVSLGVA